MTVHTMCQVAGQLNVNHFFVCPAARLPTHWRPQMGCVIQPSTGISHTPRFRVPARRTRAFGWKTRSPTHAFGRLAAKDAQLAPPFVVSYTPSDAPTQARLPFHGSTWIALMDRFGSPAVQSVH